MSRLSSFARAYWLDGLIVFAALEAPLEVVVRQGQKDAPQTTLWFDVPAIAILPLTLLARRRFPFTAPVAFWALGAAFSFVDGRLVSLTAGVFVAGMIAAFLLGSLPDDAQARIGLAIVLGSASVIVYNVPNRSFGDLLFIPVLFAIAWVAGLALHERAAQAEAAEERATVAEREREAATRVAIAEERARIARELHDVVAHSVSVMVLQVGAVRHRLPGELADDKDALQGVERVGRTALAEMRQLLGAMRRHGEDADLTPQPGLDSLEALLDEVRRAGLPVFLHVDGEPSPLPRALDLSAYRIVQEGLTNTLKHAHAHRADVAVRYGYEEVRIEVRDDGDGAAAGDGLGHGLIGVRERVKIYGGEMTAGAGPAGGFVLSTRLPLKAPS